MKAYLYDRRHSIGAILLGAVVILGWNGFSALTGVDADRLILGSTLYFAARAYLKSGWEA